MSLKLVLTGKRFTTGSTDLQTFVLVANHVNHDAELLTTPGAGTLQKLRSDRMHEGDMSSEVARISNGSKIFKKNKSIKEIPERHIAWNTSKFA